MDNILLSVTGKLGCHSPGSRGGSDPSGGSSSGPPGGHQVDLHVMYSAFRSQHHTPSVGKLKIIFRATENNNMLFQYAFTEELFQASIITLKMKENSESSC
jgi:hypothetical protein